MFTKNVQTTIDGSKWVYGYIYAEADKSFVRSESCIAKISDQSKPGSPGGAPWISTTPFTFIFAFVIEADIFFLFMSSAST